MAVAAGGEASESESETLVESWGEMRADSTTTAGFEAARTRVVPFIASEDREGRGGTAWDGMRRVPIWFFPWNAWMDYGVAAVPRCTRFKFAIRKTNSNFLEKGMMTMGIREPVGFSPLGASLSEKLYQWIC